MRLILVALLFCLSLFGNNNRNTNLNITGNTNLMEIPYKLKSWESYVYKKDNKFYEAYTTKLFTGTGILLNKNGLARIVIYKGLINGKYELFDKVGEVILKEKYAKGIKQGLSREWDEDNQVKSLVYKDGVEFEGWIRNKDSNLVFNDFKKTGWEYIVDGNDIRNRYKKIYEANDVVNIMAFDDSGKEIVEISSGAIANKCKVDLIKWKYKYEPLLDGSYNISYSLNNNHNKSIKNITGSLRFEDLLGNELYSIVLKEEVLINANKGTTFKDNYLIDSTNMQHYKMKSMDKKDVVPELIVDKIVFEDNSILFCNQ